VLRVAEWADHRGGSCRFTAVLGDLMLHAGQLRAQCFQHDQPTSRGTAHGLGNWFRLHVANSVVLALASTVTGPADGRGRDVWAGKGGRQ
jgi:hypothetical protein